MLKTKTILLAFIGLLVTGHLRAKNVFPADTTMEVQLYTNGTVAFSGPTLIGAVKGLVNKAQGSIIKQVEQKAQNETKILTKKEDKGKSHGNAQITVEKNTNLRFQTAIGNVSLTDVEGKIKGRVENGAITITRGKGKMEINTDKGDITVNDSEASGFVMTRSGNITLQDPKGQLTGISQNGKVNVKTTTNYFKGRKASPMVMNYDQADLDIATTPEGGNFSVLKGNISVLNAQKGVVMRTDEGNLGVSLASNGVRAMTRKGKVSVQVANNANSSEPIIIEAQEGDVDLIVPRNFAGTFIITLVQTKYLHATYLVLTSMDLGKIATQEIRDAKTKVLMGKETQVNAVVGNGKRTVRIRVLNGNVTIKPV